MNQLLLVRESISDSRQMTKPASKIRFKAKLFRPQWSRPALGRSEREARLLDLSHPAKERQCEAPFAGHDGDRRHHQWLPFSSQLEPDGQKSHWLKVDRKLREAAGAEAGDVVTLEIAPAAEDTGTRGAGRSAEGSRGRRAEGAGVVVGHHAQCAPRLDPLDHLRQASRDARAPDQKCLLDARCRETTRLLLRPLRVLQ